MQNETREKKEENLTIMATIFSVYGKVCRKELVVAGSKDRFVTSARCPASKTVKNMLLIVDLHTVKSSPQ